MTTLKEQLSTDFKAAMKDKDLVRKELVQLVRAGVLQIEKDQQIEADDAVVISVVQKEVKKRRELMNEIGTSRPDLSEKAEAEIAVLENYLPKQFSEVEVTGLIRGKVEALGATSMKDMGKVMKDLMPLVQGKADGSDVSRILKSLLS